MRNFETFTWITTTDPKRDPYREFCKSNNRPFIEVAVGSKFARANMEIFGTRWTILDRQARRELCDLATREDCKSNRTYIDVCLNGFLKLNLPRVVGDLTKIGQGMKARYPSQLRQNKTGASLC